MGLDGYVLREPLGEGSAAVVWRAEPAGTPGRIVAVKRLRGPADPAAVADLRREAEALERLSHPSILRLLEVVEDGDGVALILPQATGGSLAARIAAAPDGLDPAVVADLGARLGGALAAAHNLGLVHRDIKPANVLFDAEGQPLLADFGTARLLGDRAAVAGTAEYLAPEVAAGEPAGARSDVYGLGVTCYEALTGTPPYAGSTPQATLRAADRGRHVPLREVVSAPPALLDAVEDAIARDPERRPATAAELGGRLDEARRELEDGGEAAPPPPPAVAGSGAGVLGARPDPEARGHHDPRQAAPAATPSATAGPDERSGTQLFGPAPPRPEAATESRSGVDRRLLIAAAVLVVLVPVGVVGWLLTSDGDGTPADEPTAGAPAPDADDGVAERVPAEACDDVEPAEVDGDPRVVPADVDGRDCTVPVLWDGARLHVPRADAEPRRYELDAEDGDELLFGDWTCDERETPALYRPSTGEVFLFDGFAEDGEVTVSGEATGVAEGEAMVLVDDDGCHRVEVEEP